jgi:hypothetical protein
MRKENKLFRQNQMTRQKSTNIKKITWIPLHVYQGNSKKKHTNLQKERY